MSDKEEIIPKEEEKELEKGNMKISLIPKVIIKGSSAKNELETECIKETLETHPEQQSDFENNEESDNINKEIKDEEEKKIIDKDFQKFDNNKITEITQKKKKITQK